MNRYKPGQSFRASVTSTSLQVLADPTNLTIEMELPDGSVSAGLPVRDSVGQWHADFLIPFTMADGIGVWRAQSTGVAIGQNACKERRFRVDRLDF